MNTHKDLLVWQRSIDLVVMIYEVTNSKVDKEKFEVVEINLFEITDK